MNDYVQTKFNLKQNSRYHYQPFLFKYTSMRYIRRIHYVVRVLFLRLGGQTQYEFSRFLLQHNIIFEESLSCVSCQCINRHKKSKCENFSDTSVLGHNKSLTNFHLKIRIFIICKSIQQKSFSTSTLFYT